MQIRYRATTTGTGREVAQNSTDPGPVAYLFLPTDATPGSQTAGKFTDSVVKNQCLTSTLQQEKTINP